MMINDGHKHNIRIVDKQLKCLSCGHTQDEIKAARPRAVAPPHTVVASPPPVAAIVLQNSPPPIVSPVPVTLSATAKVVLSALEVKADAQTILVSVDDKGTVRANIFGMWTGKFIKAALRAIETQYKVIKHNTTRMAVQAQADEKHRQKSLSNPVVETKGV